MDGLQLLMIYSTVFGINIVTKAVELCGETQLFEASTNATLFTSPNFPEFYPSNLDCKWWIYTNEYDMKIRLQFNLLDIENSTNCENDRLTIWQVYNGLEKVVDICGKSTPKKRLHLGSDIRINFRSNNSTEGRGFVIQYLMMEDRDKDGDNENEGEYTNHWGSILIAVCALFVVTLIVLAIVICYCSRKRAKEQNTREAYTVSYEQGDGNDGGDGGDDGDGGDGGDEKNEKTENGVY